MTYAKILMTMFAAGLMFQNINVFAEHNPSGDQSHAIEKKVIKWAAKENDVDVKKHYEIITENGVTTAYEIDDLGNRIVTDISKIDHIKKLDMEALSGKKVMRIRKHISGEDVDGQSGDHKVIVKKFAIGKNETGINEQNIFAFDTDKDVEIHLDGEHQSTDIHHNKALMLAAESLLNEVNSDQYTPDTQRKIDDARQAIDEALNALSEE